MKSIEDNFDDPQVNELLTKHFIELRSVSPAGSTHVLDIQGLKDQSIKFWSLWENDELIGCGALKFLDEIKNCIKNDKNWQNNGINELKNLNRLKVTEGLLGKTFEDAYTSEDIVYLLDSINVFLIILSVLCVNLS